MFFTAGGTEQENLLHVSKVTEGERLKLLFLHHLPARRGHGADPRDPATHERDPRNRRDECLRNYNRWLKALKGV